ncbi:arginine biosynthesis bifunctional protein ArgJ [bacterium BMS3Abin06]|nr:arginine biosynthesis bifunctional protein ArgJ [bacterium BMS3Abin06]
MKKVSGNPEIIIPGFKFAGIPAGIKTSGERDLALIFSESPAVTAALFTTNKIKAAPVRLSMERLASHKKCRSIIINSGNANACTGKPGLKNAREMMIKTAEELGISTELVCVSSTGKIGVPLPMEKIKRALPALVRNLSPLSLNHAASAILTTDTATKISSRKVKIGRKTGIIAGIAKGSGMIRPGMATMLSFIVTDISINPKALDSALREAVNRSFNRITVDNEMSTNDTVMMMANGNLRNIPLTMRAAVYSRFKGALNDVTYDLARMIAEDGEGATKLIEIIVRGAKTESDAENVASSVANSMLVKTAVYGRDPNWGRIMAAAGYSGAAVDEQKIDIYINKIKLASKGMGTDKESAARKTLANKKILITIDLGIGKETSAVLTCDLTEEYVKINAHYGT